MPKKEGAKEKAANKAQAEADARAKAAEDASWADDDRGKSKKDGKKVRATTALHPHVDFLGIAWLAALLVSKGSSRLISLFMLKFASKDVSNLLIPGRNYATN